MNWSQRKIFFYLASISAILGLAAPFPVNAYYSNRGSYDPSIYEARLPHTIAPPGQNMVVVNPVVHAWGAYNADGYLIRGGQATAGSSWCRDLGRPCRTKVGSFHVISLGSYGCKSSIFPVGRGGAPMPYCMYFNHGQALHGVHEGEVVDGNISHGCVRLHVQDAEWLRFNFVTLGTRVVVLPY